MPSMECLAAFVSWWCKAFWYLYSISLCISSRQSLVLPCKFMAGLQPKITSWIESGSCCATLVTTLVYLKVSARERWTLSLILTACAVVFVYGLFEKGLGVPFPDGQLLVWLGLIR